MAIAHRLANKAASRLVKRVKADDMRHVFHALRDLRHGPNVMSLQIVLNILPLNHEPRRKIPPRKKERPHDTIYRPRIILRP